LKTEDLTLHFVGMTDPVILPIKPTTRERAQTARPVPPEVFFICSAIFHYLGPAFAVLLFARVDVLGVAWLRIASAAVVFAFWKRPWHLFAELGTGERRTVVALGFVLAAMNVCFYLAINRLPLGTVGTIEFLGPIALAALGVRTMRNLAALLLACSGVFLLTSVRISGEPIGYIFAFANCALFVLYILLGHRIAASGGRAGVERLAMAMLIAGIVVTPIGLRSASGALLDPILLLAGAGVGICSSVIPYICDQFAMARLSKATFALMLSLLPATACLVGIVVLRQIPSISELGGVGAVIAGVALKRSADD
jgi:inner membrane transporter RhtA